MKRTSCHQHTRQNIAAFPLSAVTLPYKKNPKNPTPKTPKPNNNPPPQKINYWIPKEKRKGVPCFVKSQIFFGKHNGTSVYRPIPLLLFDLIFLLTVI